MVAICPEQTCDTCPDPTYCTSIRSKHPPTLIAGVDNVSGLAFSPRETDPCTLCPLSGYCGKQKSYNRNRWLIVVLSLAILATLALVAFSQDTPATTTPVYKITVSYYTGNLILPGVADEDEHTDATFFVAGTLNNASLAEYLDKKTVGLPYPFITNQIKQSTKQLRASSFNYVGEFSTKPTTDFLGADGGTAFDQQIIFNKNGPILTGSLYFQIAAGKVAAIPIRIERIDVTNLD